MMNDTTNKTAEGPEDRPYEGLTPEVILDAVESAGFRADGRLSALNSYENRVYEVGIDEGRPLIAKFYRKGRWTDLQIEEEHAFTLELAENEIPAVAPLVFGGKGTLLTHEGFRFALFPKEPGRTPELEDRETLLMMGRLMGRIHAVGRTRSFKYRPAININTFGEEAVKAVLLGGSIPSYLAANYGAVAGEVLRLSREAYLRAGIPPDEPYGIRLHGDCHTGNLLWTDKGAHFVDFDDTRTGPAVQDLWMLISGGRDEREEALSLILKGYLTFTGFDFRELHIIEALRALRQIHHSAWLSARYSDPAFPVAFPWFGTPRYWEGQILALREQASLLDEPPLSPDPDGF